MTNHNLRDVYGRTLVELGKENKNVVVLEADLGKSTMTCYFEDAFPNRFFEMGIAEANMTSFAAGLSLTGKIAFTNSFAVFAAGRSYDQIRQSICLPKLNVKIVGSSAGLSDYGDGSTHQTVEDIAIMRAIPNMTVLVPADAVETAKMTRAAAAHEGPVYLRITRSDLPDVVPENEEIVIGKPYLLRDGSDVVVYACGAMVSAALEAAEAAKAQGLSLRVVNVSSLKPIDEAALKKLADGVKAIVTAEEHSLIGGLASVVTYAFRGSALPIECIGIADKFGQSAENINVLMEAYGLTAAEILKAAVAAKRKATV
ncbi:transketolase C-terminal domain-containing protein [Xanthobacteraceae bacterium Astr-EGSB]|uniref:transketolase family protein n=1 Tax=Astrobacterium formosum TaxID=3069710 RepID=UPI0027B02B05|nr:transketolase C-terminal domain-containing protein [Xanthobacteraceae bacterium Astr-EGSB]